MESPIKWSVITCATEGCHTISMVPEEVLNRIRETHENIHCIYGHGLYFPAKTNEEKLRERIQAKDDIIASKDREIAKLRRPKRKPRATKKTA